MLTRRVADTPEFLAGDHTVLRELLHPAKVDVLTRFSLAHGRLARGRASKRHRLKSTEVYYFVSGRGTFHVGDQTKRIEPGLVVHVPPGAVQWVESGEAEDLEFLCLVDPAWRAEDEEILE